MKDKNTVWLFWLAIAFLAFNAFIFYEWNQIDEIDARLMACEKQMGKFKQSKDMPDMFVNQGIYLFDCEPLSDPEFEQKLEYIGKFAVTAYNASADCCAPYDDGYTATMTVPAEGVTVAADWDVLPAGTKIYIDGIGVRTVEDSGVKGNVIDLYFEDYDTALNFGMQNLDVWVIS